MQTFTANLRRRLKYLDYAPVVFISALKGQSIGKLIGAIAQVAGARRARVSTAEMNRFLAEVDFGRATTPGGRSFRLYYLTQAATSPPTFVAFTNQPGKLHFALERFLENRIRQRFGFLGTPIVIKSRQSK